MPKLELVLRGVKRVQRKDGKDQTRLPVTVDILEKTTVGVAGRGTKVRLSHAMGSSIPVSLDSCGQLEDLTQLDNGEQS